MWLSNAREVLLIRHAEKTGLPGDSSLSDRGLSRALALAVVLPERFGKPDIIIACRSVPKSSRPVETVRPLAAKLGLPIRDDWNTDDYDELARTRRSHRRLLAFVAALPRRHAEGWRRQDLYK